MDEKRTWGEFAELMVRVYGSWLDEKEGFVICAECAEPIYFCDYEDHDFTTCPICCYNFETEEYEE